MGVDLETWCATIKKYPLKYRFTGLSGFHTDVREAFVHADRAMDDYMCKEHKHVVDNLDEFLEPYIDMLIYRLRVGRHDSGLVDQANRRAFEYTREFMEQLEHEVCHCREEETRWEFATDFQSCEMAWGDIRGNDPEYLLEKHPPVEVWNEAYGCGFPVESVVYVCPSCHVHPMTTDELADNGGRHYCSMCGSEYLDPEVDLRTEEGQKTFSEALEVQLWPLR